MSDQLLAVPLKIASEVDVTAPLKAVLKAKGYRPLEADWFKEFEKLRSLSVDKTLAKNQTSVDTLSRYHDQLLALQEKGVGNVPDLSLYWESSLERGGFFGGKYYTCKSDASSFEFERVAILYNLAALQTSIGMESYASGTDEGMRNAAKSFQNAAGIFLCLCDTKQETLAITAGYTLTNDLHPDALTALASIMIAQAQEIIIAKGISDSMKDAILSKVCAQGEDLYKEALINMKKDTVRNLWDGTWMNHIKAKQLALAGLAEFYQSKVCSSKKLIGEQLARLQLAQDSLRKAQDKLGTGGFVTKFVAEAEKQHKIAKKDNDMIYLELVPAPEKLETIDRVASAKVAKAITCPEKLSPNFKDIFDGMAIDPNAVDPPTLAKILGSTAQALGKYVVQKIVKS